MADLTRSQARYLAFVYAYIKVHGRAPSEFEAAAHLGVSKGWVNKTVQALKAKGLIQRDPRRHRSIRILVPEKEIPFWKKHRPARRKPSRKRPARRRVVRSRLPWVRVYVVSVTLLSGPTSPELTGKEISRVIEIRGDQTLEELHYAIFNAYDRWDDHIYEFQFGKRPFDPEGRNYGAHCAPLRKAGDGNARKTRLNDVKLKRGRPFGYWFDFGDDWYHQLEVIRIGRAISRVTYPRVIKRVGKSPPQYDSEESR
jgi:hypothetical protein